VKIRAPTFLLLAVVGFLLAACLPDPATVVQGRRIVVFGDSLTLQAEPHMSQFGVRTHASNSTAPCDWLSSFARTVQSEQPTHVVLAFTGNHLTPCMQGRADTLKEMNDAYFYDLYLLASQTTAQVSFVVPPYTKPNIDYPNTVFTNYAWHGDPSIGNTECYLASFAPDHARCDFQARDELGQNWGFRLDDGVHLNSVGAELYGNGLIAAANW